MLQAPLCSWPAARGGNEQSSRQDADLLGLRIGGFAEGATDLGRMRREAERAQRAAVQVAFSDEEHALACGVLPFGDLGALDADRTGDLPVSELEKVQCLVAVLADEDDDGAL